LTDLLHLESPINSLQMKIGARNVTGRTKDRERGFSGLPVTSGRAFLTPSDDRQQVAIKRCMALRERWMSQYVMVARARASAVF